MSSPQPPKRPFGIDLIGHVTGPFGLGVAARNTLALLERLGVPTAAVDVPGGDGRTGGDMSLDRLLGAPDHGVALYHMNPPEIARMLAHRPRWFAPESTLNACVPFWELPRVPVGWEPVLGGMDVVLAPTRFVGDAVRAALPSAEIVPYPQAVRLPAGVAPDRERWGLPAEAIVFLVTFNTGSGLARKNPLAAVRAFAEAFGSASAPHAFLALRVNLARVANPKAAAEQNAQLAAIREALRGLPSAVIDEPLSYADVLSLYASSDVMVSLHRSEGLGLHLMEAMALGKPVIATMWSGNTDFMTAENSCPVGYRLVRVSETADVPRAYTSESVGADLEWADPDEREAAAWMRRLAGDAALRQSLGARALADMRSALERFERGEPFAELRRRYDAFDPAEAEHERRAAELRRLWRFDVAAVAKDWAKRVLR